MESVAEKLQKLSIKDKKAPIRCKEYLFQPIPSLSIPLLSYNIPEYTYKQKGFLPINARGLFMRKDNSKIVVRGYDKFFNINEVESTTWEYLDRETIGPYELTLKENGCIIYVTSIDGHILVTSKHAFGSIDNPTGKPSHSQKGEEWLDKHLGGVSTRKELSNYLENHNVTAVFELADDDFEEHVLEYPHDKRGLYCHGLNYNEVEFKTMSTVKVHEFAKQFGFFFVKLIMKETCKEVREFSEKCAQTGSYEGSPIEGFVVRCHRMEKEKQVTHFFKIKFDEPYMMFREWRECTRSIIAKRPIRKSKFGLTDKYILWAQGKFRQQPHLFKKFNEGKGIIALRNMFLQEVEGITNFIGPEVIALCKITPIVQKRESIKGKEKTLLIPIATIASGKTTLARCLTNLFSNLIGHIQNDNIQAKKAAPVFEQQIMESFLTHDIVFADRNNHLFQHRSGLCNAFKAEYPGGKIIALDWNISSLDKKFVMGLTARRIELRGENHQSLTPKKVREYKAVIGSFVMRRDELDLESDADSLINEVIKMDIQAPVLENLELVLHGLDLKIPSSDELQKALEKARNHQETITKVVRSAKKRNSKLPSFYAVKMKPSFFEQLKEAFKNEKREDLFKMITDVNQGEWHMTIVYRSATDHELLIKYDEMLKRLEEFPDEKDPEQLLDKKILITSSNLIMNDRIVVLQVEKTEPDIKSINKYRHITLALLDSSAKAMESNDLIKRYENSKNSSTGNIQCFPLQLEIEGEVRPFF